MAVGIYIGSTASYSGKNMIVMGISLKLQKEGYKIGYMKPIGALPKDMDGKLGDDDAFCVQSVLGLSDEPSLVTPVLITQDFKVKALHGDTLDYLPTIKKAYVQLSRDKDIMIVAGSGGMYTGRYSQLTGVRIVQKLDLKALVIDRLYKELNYDFLAVLKDTLKEAMLGAILNDIPANLMNEVELLIKPFLERTGIKVLGIVPKDPLMGAIKISELAERLGGKIISAHNKAEKVVESFLIGSMQVENFLTHFRKSKNSAVIVGGDRSDVQLVALEGNCPCLVLTGNLYPNNIILTRSEILSVPIVVVRKDTYSVAKTMETILSSHKLRSAIKIKQGAQLISSSLDFDYLKAQLGLV
ncbi:putative DRTGG domai protein [Desulfovibrionales bacterium]